MVNHFLVRFVVGPSDVSPVILSKELISSVDNLVKLAIGLFTSSHRLAPQILRVHHHLIATFIVLSAVAPVSSREISVESGDLD